MTTHCANLGTPRAARGTVRVAARWMLLLALVAVPWELSATLVAPADFAEMVGESQIIVHGRVADVQAHVTSDRRTIESMVTVRVTQSLKGDSGATVVFRVPSGQVGRYRRVTVGAPEFRTGDEIVVFLKGRPPVVPMPYGLHQGVYRVQRVSRGRPVVVPATAVGAGDRQVRGDPAQRVVAIEAFVEQVLAVTQGASSRRIVYLPREAGALAPAPEAGRVRPERRP